MKTQCFDSAGVGCVRIILQHYQKSLVFGTTVIWSSSRKMPWLNRMQVF